MSSPPPVLAAGTLLHDTYEIVRRVGSGGMGEVYEARHARLPGRFAVKVLAVRVGAGSAEFRRFRREAEIASTLRHPNVVQVVDFNLMRDGSPYLVMEFLEGSDLSQEIQRFGRLSPLRTASIVGQVGAGLAQAHAAGVVHRDLKPQNVFLVPFRGRGGDFVKVLDFGISKVKSASTVTTEPALMGTPQYMSPEQAHGRAHEVDATTDQFALGAMAWEMLCGHPPFSGDSVPSLLYEIANTEPPPLGRPFLDPEVEVVLRRALSKPKQDRYPSILEFADALDRALLSSGPRDAVMRAPPRAPVTTPAPTRTHGLASQDSGTLKPAVSTIRRKLTGTTGRRLALIAGSALSLAAVAALLTRARRPPPIAAERAPRPPTRVGVQIKPLVPPSLPSPPPAAAGAAADAGAAPAVAGTPARRPAAASSHDHNDRKRQRDAPSKTIPLIDKL